MKKTYQKPAAIAVELCAEDMLANSVNGISVTNVVGEKDSDGNVVWHSNRNVWDSSNWAYTDDNDEE